MKITKTKVFFFFLTTIILTNHSFAQKIAGYSFDKYPAKEIYKGKKVTVNLKSSNIATSNRTQIINQYNESKIEFGGKYSFIFWGAGTGLTLGAMVDNKTGNVYNLPLTEENSTRGFCGYDISEEDNKLYKKNSNLFITFTWSCEEIKVTKTNVITKNYSIFIWDEANKKFSLLKNKTEKKTEKITSK